MGARRAWSHAWRCRWEEIPIVSRSPECESTRDPGRAHGDVILYRRKRLHAGRFVRSVLLLHDGRTVDRAHGKLVVRAQHVPGIKLTTPALQGERTSTMASQTTRELVIGDHITTPIGTGHIANMECDWMLNPELIVVKREGEEELVVFRGNDVSLVSHGVDGCTCFRCTGEMSPQEKIALLASAGKKPGEGYRPVLVNPFAKRTSVSGWTGWVFGGDGPRSGFQGRGEVTVSSPKGLCYPKAGSLIYLD